MANDTEQEIEDCAATYGRLLVEMRADIDEFLETRALSRARELSARTDQHFNHNGLPLFFTGDLDAPLVLVHLNPKQDDNTEPVFDGDLPIGSFEEYFDHCRHFGARAYGSGSPRSHRSSFDHKQIRFLRPFGIIDFVEEHSIVDRFTNLERVCDNKLQLELIPYGSATFSTVGFTSELLQPHYERIMAVIAARPRRYVIFCGAVFDKLFRDHVVEEHTFNLRKQDGTAERQASRFAVLKLPYENTTITAGLAHSWARQGIPMSSYGDEIRVRYPATDSGLAS